MPRQHRLFIAVDPAADVAAKAARIVGRLRDAGVDAAWVPTTHLHLTLHFLGDDVDDADLHRICVAMDEAAATMPAFRLAYRGVGVFPDARRPRVVWLGVERGADDLVRLHDALAERLTPLGFPPESRGFRPHLTLGRFRGGGAARGAAWLPSFAEADAGEMTASRVCLYESRLAPTGAEHDRLHAARLGGG